MGLVYTERQPSVVIVSKSVIFFLFLQRCHSYLLGVCYELDSGDREMNERKLAGEVDT